MIKTEEKMGVVNCVKYLLATVLIIKLIKYKKIILIFNLLNFNSILFIRNNILIPVIKQRSTMPEK